MRQSSTVLRQPASTWREAFITAESRFHQTSISPALRGPRWRMPRKSAWLNKRLPSAAARTSPGLSPASSCAAGKNIGDQQAMVASHRETDIFGQGPNFKIFMLIERFCDHCRRAQDIVYLMAMEARLSFYLFVSAVEPDIVTRKLTWCFDRGGELRRRAVDVPSSTTQVIVMFQNTLQGGDQSGLRNAGSI